MNAAQIMKTIRGTSPTVVLVGNGPSACKHPFGELIDLFDEVVRFNNYYQHLKGVENFLGSKTSTWVLGEHMSGTVRPQGSEQLVRIVPQGLSKEFHADAVFLRDVNGVDAPSSGVVMASKFATLSMKIYTVGMDGYTGNRRNWWDEADEDGKHHDHTQEAAFWLTHSEQVIPLEELL